MFVKKIIPAVLFSAAVFLLGCKDGEYSLEDLDTDNIALRTGVNGPLFKSDISFRDLFLISGVKEEKSITIEGKDGQPEKIQFNPNTLDKLIAEHNFDKEPIKLLYEDENGEKIDQEIDMQNPLDGFNVAKCFDKEDGAIDSLGKLVLRVKYRNDWPFEGRLYVRAVKMLTKTEALPESMQPAINRQHWNDYYVDLKAKQSGSGEVRFDYSNTELFRASDRLSIDFYIFSAANNDVEIMSTDSLQIDVQGTLNGKFIINNF